MNDKIRLSLELSAKFNEKLEQLARDTDSTKTEVIRKALALMEVAIDSQKNGASLSITSKDGQLVTKIVGL